MTISYLSRYSTEDAAAAVSALDAARRGNIDEAARNDFYFNLPSRYEEHKGARPPLRNVIDSLPPSYSMFYRDFVPCLLQPQTPIKELYVTPNRMNCHHHCTANKKAIFDAFYRGNNL